MDIFSRGYPSDDIISSGGSFFLLASAFFLPYIPARLKNNGL
jgi:hypothetical protein